MHHQRILHVIQGVKTMTFIDWVAFSLALIAALASILIGVVVWFSEKSNRLRAVFLWLSLFVALWIICNVLYSKGPESLRFPLALISYTAAIFVVTTTLAFVMKLVKMKFGIWQYMALALGYISGCLAAIPGLVGIGVEGISIVTRTSGLITYGLIVIGFLFISCFILLRHLRTAGRVLKRQIRLVLYGVLAASLIGVTFNLVLPLLGEYHFTQIGPAGATVFVFYIAYSIARYNLFDIRLAIVRIIAYVATFATLAGIYFVLAFLITTALNGAFLAAGQTIFNVATALVMAVLLQPIKRFFDKLTDKVFFRDNYTKDEFYTALNKILSTTSDLRDLLEQTSYLLADTLKAEQAFFFTYVNEDHYVSAGTEAHARLAMKEIHILNEHVDEQEGRLLLESQMDADNAVRRMMVSHRIALILPLYHTKDIIGYVCLGGRQSGDYTRRDLKLLSTIADELVIAVQNAQSVQEVKELNLHLEQRISSATKELRASNSQLQRLDEAKDEFISMASHQLRTPLTSIKGYLSMLIEGDVGEVTKEQKHLLSEAFVSSERMVRLIGDFLNVSRLQTGKFVIEKHPIDLALLVQREVEGLASNASARGMKFVYKKPKNIPILELDENKIQQVVMNFADNAIYYSKEKAKIVVELKKTDRFVEFTVSDTGIGVPKSDQAHLFTKFYRASNARKARPDGTGVGLFLAKKVIDDHGGSIIFNSVEGKGSTFGFKLPIPKTTK